MRARGCVPLIVFITLAACASETPPLDPESVPLPRPAPQSQSLVAPLPRPAPKSLTQQSIPWRHLPQPVSDEEPNLDQAKCALAGKLASSTGSPELKFNLVFADVCVQKAMSPFRAFTAPAVSTRFLSSDPCVKVAARSPVHSSRDDLCYLVSVDASARR